MRRKVYVKINNIELKYDNESSELTSAEVSYSLMLNDGQLDGSMTIENNATSFTPMSSWPLFEFNKFIHQKIISSM